MCMRKKIDLLILIIIFSAIIIGGFVTIPKKKNLHIDSNDIVCVQIRKSNKNVTITNRSEIEKIVDILNSIQYKKKHPYIKAINILTGKDNDDYISSNAFGIALFNEEQEHYFFKDGFQRITLSANNSGSTMKINSQGYELVNIDEVLYKDYFKELVEKYSKE